MTYAYVVLTSLVFLALHVWRMWPGQASPDGHWYLTAANGQPVPTPYNRRWLLPLFLKEPKSWFVWTSCFFVLACLLMLPLKTSVMTAVCGTVLFAGLVGTSLNFVFPVLTDMTAMALALLAAWCAAAIHPLLGLAVAIVASASKEPAALFAALWAHEPLLAIGVTGAVPGLLAPTIEAPLTQPWLKMPVTYARGARDIFDWKALLLPLGALVPLTVLGWSSANLGLWELAAVGLAFAQLFTAMDTARLTWWAAPILIPAALHAPVEALLVGTVLHPFISHAYRGA